MKWLVPILAFYLPVALLCTVELALKLSSSACLPSCTLEGCGVGLKLWDARVVPLFCGKYGTFFPQQQCYLLPYPRLKSFHCLEYFVRQDFFLILFPNVGSEKQQGFTIFLHANFPSSDGRVFGKSGYFGQGSMI